MIICENAKPPTPPATAFEENALVNIRRKVSGIAVWFLPIMTNAIAINKSDINGTSMEAILPMRLIPPIITIAAKNATIPPIISLTAVESLFSTAVYEPVILFV